MEKKMEHIIQRSRTLILLGIMAMIGSFSFDVAKAMEDEQLEEGGRSALSSLALKSVSSNIQVAKLLFESFSKNDRIVGRKSLYFMAQEENKSSSNVEAAELLFKSEEVRDKEIGRTVLYDVVAHPEMYYRTDAESAYQDQLLLQLKAVNTLVEAGDEKDKNIAMEKIDRIYFLASEGSHNRYDGKSLKIIQLMSYNKNPLMLKALQSLWSLNDEQDRKHVIFKSLELAKEGQYKAAKFLAERDEKAYLEGMRYIVQMVSHPNRFEAAKILYDKGGNYSDEGKKALREISQQKNHPDQKEAKETLESCLCM